MLSLRGLFFYGFTSHVYYFRPEIYNKTIIEFSLWFSPLEMYNKTKCTLRIGSAHNKGGGEALDINMA